jgi:D-alanyl-D-alanine carboxypeptidase
MRLLFFLLFSINILFAQEDCPKAWMYYEWRVDLRKITLEEYQIEVPIDKIQIDFLGAPVGVPYKFGYKFYVKPEEVAHFEEDEFALHQQAYEALKALRSAALADSLHLPIHYSYRSIEEQRKVYKRFGAKVAEKPGMSEHHLYTTIDLKWVSDHNERFLWLLENAFDYGWVPSYYFRVDQRLKKEPWHWRYVGKLAADKFYCAWKDEIEAKIEKIKKAQ